MKENLKTLSDEQRQKVQEYYNMYLGDMERLNQLEKLLKDCQNNMDADIILSKRGCMLKSNIEKLVEISSNKKHKIEGSVNDKHEITKLLIDNNELEVSSLNDSKYYHLLSAKEQLSLKKAITFLTATILFFTLAVSGNTLFYLVTLLMFCSSVKEFRDYITEKPYKDNFNGNLNNIKLKKFQDALEKDYQNEMKKSIQIYNYNMDFFSAKEKILISVLDLQKANIKDDVSKINGILGSIYEPDQENKVEIQNAHQLKKTRLN